MQAPELQRGSRALTVLAVLAAAIGALGLIGYMRTPSTADTATATTTSTSTTTSQVGSVERIGVDGFGAVALSVTPPGEEPRSYCALIANNEDLMERGMMGRQDLGGYDAMVFPFAEDSTARFYMANVDVPLSIAWIAADGALVSTADMQPFDTDPSKCPTYGADGNFRFAIEVLQGGLDDLGIVEGAKVRADGPCP